MSLFHEESYIRIFDGQTRDEVSIGDFGSLFLDSDGRADLDIRYRVNAFDISTMRIQKVYVTGVIRWTIQTSLKEIHAGRNILKAMMEAGIAVKDGHPRATSDGISVVPFGKLDPQRHLVIQRDSQTPDDAFYRVRSVITRKDWYGTLWSLELDHGMDLMFVGGLLVSLHPQEIDT